MEEQGSSRRLSAVLIADIAGYTKLVEQDTEGTVSELKSVRSSVINPAISHLNGRIVKHTGDGFLAEFPSVQDAVDCAIEMQTGLRTSSLNFRMAVNLGDVIDDGEDIYGEGVNIAARLETLADPGGISISGGVFDQVRNRVKANFEDLGEHEVKHVSAPVRVYKIEISISDATPSNKSSDTKTLPDKPSIAVLPFDNMSGDPEQEFFADGMAEDIITELSRFENLFVIDRNSSASYKGQDLDIKNIENELAVKFVLKGSIRKVGQKVRITAQLIDVSDGGHIWAERYDGSLEDIFDFQERVTREVVSTIDLKISQTELDRVTRGERVFDAVHESAWRANSILNKAFDERLPKALDEAIQLAKTAVDIDPKCGKAYEVICRGYAMKSLFRWGEEIENSAVLATQWADTFFSQLPNSYMAYYCRGLARLREGNYSAANLDFEQAHILNPNDSNVLRWWACCEAHFGSFECAKKHANMAILLSPKDRGMHVAFLALAMCAFIQRENKEFELWANKAIQASPNAPIRRAMMIAYAAEMDNKSLLDEHKKLLAQSAPNFISSLLRGENIIFEKAEHTEFLLNGLRKAGY